MVDLPKYQYEHINEAHYFRGLLINEFTGLEKAIESYLTMYFLGASNKRQEFSNIILDRLTFEAKRASLKTIFDNRSIENGFVKTKSNSYPHNKLFDDIRKLNEQRNYFAHYLITIPHEVSDKVIGLAEFRDQIKIKWYTLSEYEKIINQIKEITKNIDEFILELKST